MSLELQLIAAEARMRTAQTHSSVAQAMNQVSRLRRAIKARRDR